ncbi:Sec-independent protein translocase protein TatB [Hoeflea sp. AS60]|uniref:Sec-independent protein translocase protein TatB n=1 Tax=Hoeflea sp. AS60 TaxID=3135780 RepID=UPI003179C506
MFDIGWPELLVVAIVLIVVVGPKDLPPMLRAFGRTTKKLRAMASEFRGQFDDALREAELDDVKKTFDSARKLNPMQSIRDAVNPLKDTARDIKSDLEKSVKTPSSPAEEPPKMAAPEPTMKLSDGPPDFKAEVPVAKTADASDKTEAKPAVADTTGSKPAAAKASKAGKAQASAKTKPAASTPAASKAAAAPKSAAAKPAAAKPAASKSAAKATTASSSKPKAPAKPASAKSAPRAKKPKQGEGQA